MQHKVANEWLAAAVPVSVYANLFQLQQEANLALPLLTLAAVLGFQVANLLQALLRVRAPKPRLENHRMCKITTGGMEECYRGCDCQLVASRELRGYLARNIE